MAATKKILKLTHGDANVKITSTAADTATIGIQTDLKLGSESFSLGVVAVALSTGGSGYTAPPQVVFNPVGTGGTDASAVAVLTSGAVSEVRVTNYGSGYTAPPGVSFIAIGTGGSGAAGTASLYTGARVAIDKIMWSVSPVAGSYMTLTRNSEAVATLYGTGEMDLNARGMTDDTHAAYDILATFTGSGGTAYLKLKKVSGYGD